MKKVAVIMGSDSDWPVVKAAVEQLKDFGIPYEAHILSAHRTPVEAAAYASSARENGIGVIICAAGMAAHLAGAFAANTTLPVIGIPMKGGAVGRPGRSAVHRADAQRHPGSHRGAERREKRRRSGRSDPGRIRCGAGRKTGRGPRFHVRPNRSQGRKTPGRTLIRPHR